MSNEQQKEVKGRGKLPDRPKWLLELHGENKIQLWSYSRLSTLRNCIHEFYLSRVKRLPSLDNIYTVLGTYSHEILERYYTGELELEKLEEEFTNRFFEVKIQDKYRFSSDEERNKSMRDKYEKCVAHFFKHHKPMSDKKVTIEKGLYANINGHIFQGYIDAMHIEDDCLIITDFKTSSIYKQDKKEENKLQLLMYALMMLQNSSKITVDRIKCRWNFLKYVTVSYKLKNGKMKERVLERHKWVADMKKQLEKDLLELFPEDKTLALVKLQDAIDKNDLSNLPESVQEKYTLSETFVYIDVTQEEIDKLIKACTEAIEYIESLDKDNVDDWQRDEISKDDSYYCSKLCGVREHCEYYQRYLINEGFTARQPLTQVDASELDALFD